MQGWCSGPARLSWHEGFAPGHVTEPPGNPRETDGARLGRRGGRPRSQPDLHTSPHCLCCAPAMSRTLAL